MISSLADNWICQHITIGAIDGTHVTIVSPKVENTVNPALAYLNRKTCHSISMQGIQTA